MKKKNLLFLFVFSLLLSSCTAGTAPKKPVEESFETIEDEDEDISGNETEDIPENETEELQEDTHNYEQDKDENNDSSEESVSGVEEPKNIEISYNPIEPGTETPPMPAENSSLVSYNDRKSWWFVRNDTHTPPSAQQDINISQYEAYYLGDTSQKIIYLTFDEGYENGYTSQILDILKEKDVKAAFFVTKSYIESNLELVIRMVEEGHVVGNHSITHPDMTTLSDEEIIAELLGCKEYFEEITGYEMPNYFRPPEGVYSIRTLEKTQAAGYKTIFWSFAYKDWDVNNQPGRDGAYNMVMTNYHNGCIMLLHAVSQSNTEALPDIIDSLKEAGYSFASLDALN